MAPSDCNFLGWELKWSIKNTRVLHGLHLICQNQQMINIPVVGPRRSWLGPSDIKTSRTLSQFFGLPSADPQQHARKTQHVHSAAIWPKWSLYNPSDLFPLDLDTRCQVRQYLVFFKGGPVQISKEPLHPRACRKLRRCDWKQVTVGWTDCRGGNQTIPAIHVCST